MTNNKIHILPTMILLLNLVISTETQACVGFFGKEKEETPVTFDCLYPTPFYETGVFKWTAIAVVTVGVAAAIIYSGGAAAVPGATLIGGMLGTTWTAGLATLGGGTLAAGGFGMAGGAFVIAVTTDLALLGLTSFIPEDKMQGKDYSYIKIPLPEQGSNNTLLTYKKIIEITESYYDDIKKYSDIDKNDKNYEEKIKEYEEKYEKYEKIMYEKYNTALNHINTKETKYDLINGAILAYNLGKYKDSQKYLKQAADFFPKSSYIYYHQALLNLVLVEDSSESALKNLDKATKAEADALEPYLIGAQIALDTKNYQLAKHIIIKGLKNYDNNNFQLNYLGGITYFRSKDYKQAIDYFKEALNNVTINEVEADTKLWIAKSYQRMDNKKTKIEWYSKMSCWLIIDTCSNKEAEWYDVAMEEVSDNKQYKQVLQNQYREFKNGK